MFALGFGGTRIGSTILKSLIQTSTTLGMNTVTRKFPAMGSALSGWRVEVMKLQTKSLWVILSLVAVVVVLAALVPLAVIWALNTLFSLGIAYTVWTWLAVIVLLGAIKGEVKVAKE